MEEIAIQQGITVLLEQSGDAGSPGSLPSLYSSNDNVASISKTTSSGRSSQRFTLFAKNSGAAGDYDELGFLEVINGPL